MQGHPFAKQALPKIRAAYRALGLKWDDDERGKAINPGEMPEELREVFFARDEGEGEPMDEVTVKELGLIARFLQKMGWGGGDEAAKAEDIEGKAKPSPAAAAGMFADMAEKQGNVTPPGPSLQDVMTRLDAMQAEIAALRPAETEEAAKAEVPVAETETRADEPEAKIEETKAEPEPEKTETTESEPTEAEAAGETEAEKAEPNPILVKFDEMMATLKSQYDEAMKNQATAVAAEIAKLAEQVHAQGQTLAVVAKARGASRALGESETAGTAEQKSEPGLIEDPRLLGR
jgi:hypothetical protein